MRCLSLLLFVSCFSSSLFAKSPLPGLEAKMWNFLLATQVGDNTIVRTKGGWPSFSRFRGTNIQSQESNSFVTSQLLFALSNIEKNYELPGFSSASEKANQFLDLFLEDAKKTSEPSGTMAYWPLLQTTSGKWIRSFSTRFPYNRLKPFNVPNDLDVSANYFMWIFRNKNHPEFLEAFEKTAGEYTDLNRSLTHKNDLSWKKKNSGAFLTWIDPDKSEDPETRIYRGINDVDCVVNLNVLAALLLYKNQLGVLSAKTDNAYADSCKLINEAVLNKKTNVCAVWYDRSSQFYTAYSKAFTVQGLSQCLNDSLVAARLDVFDLAQNSMIHFESGKYTQIAEYISIIKKLWPPEMRDHKVLSLINKLVIKLREGIQVFGDQAYIRSTDSLFVTKLGPVTVDWYSQQYSTAIAMEALLLP